MTNSAGFAGNIVNYLRNVTKFLISSETLTEDHKIHFASALLSAL